MKMSLTGLLAIATCAMLANLWTPSAEACGGFFCTSVPVDQNAERIIFTQNGDGTVSAYVQIEYTGAAPDFSWILPLPKAIPAEAIEVPEDAMAAFRELEAATTPGIHSARIAGDDPARGRRSPYQNCKVVEYRCARAPARPGLLGRSPTGLPGVINVVWFVVQPIGNCRQSNVA